MTRTENLTVMFTDIVGYTEQTVQQSRQAGQALMRRHDQLLLPVLARFGGRLVKRIGDGMLVSFRSPTDAVRCGMALQDRLAVERAAAPDAPPIEIRVALNVGEVRVERGDIFGEAVNVAARVEGLTPAGEVWFTEGVYLAMNKAEIPSESLGARPLKGLPEPVRLYRVPAHKLARVVSGGESLASEVGALPYGGLHRGPTDFPSRLAAGLRSLAALPIGSLRQARVLRAASYALLGLAAVAALAVLLPPPAGDDAGSGVYGDTFGPASPDALPAASGTAVAISAEDSRAAAQGWLQRGHEAYIDGDRRKAARAYGEALSRDPSLADDPLLATRLVSCLSWAHEQAIPLIEAHRSPAIEAALVDRAAAPGRYGRGRAIRLLEAAGKAGSLDWTEIHLMDLDEADTCEQQIAAIGALAERGDARAEAPLRALAGPGGLRGWFAEKHCARDAARAALDAIAERESRAAEG
jgi:class 3 adenylate cyclase